MTASEIKQNLVNFYNDKKDDTAEFMERNPAIQTGLRGMAMGAGAYATLAMVKDVLDAIEDKKKEKRRKKPRISSDTLVITTPKMASARDSFSDIENSNCGKATLRQARNSDGTFASGFDVVCEDDDHSLSKCAQEEKPYRESYSPEFLERVGDISVGGALGVAGAGLGWYLTQQTYDYLKRKRLEREIAAAQKEYIDFLTKTSEVKEAKEYVGTYSDIKPVVTPSLGERAWHSMTTPSEEPENNNGGFASDALGVAGATAILLAAASSYLTKKFLDKKFDEEDSDSNIVDRTRVKNIVFKTASAERRIDVVDAVAGMTIMATLMSTKWPNEKIAEVPENYDPYEVVDALFSGMGMPGTDPTQWTYGTPGAPSLDPTKLDSVQRAVLGQFNAPETSDKLMNAVMDDRYREQRKNITRVQARDWYNGTGFGDTWLGKLIQPAADWFFGGLGSLIADTAWGKRIFADRLKKRIGKIVGQQNPADAVNENQGEGYATPGVTPGQDGTFVDPTTGKEYRVGGEAGIEPVEPPAPAAPAPAQNEAPSTASAAPAPAPAAPVPAPAAPAPAPTQAAVKRRNPNLWNVEDLEFPNGNSRPDAKPRALTAGDDVDVVPVPKGMTRILVPGTGKPQMDRDSGWYSGKDPEFPERYIDVPTQILRPNKGGQK